MVFKNGELKVEFYYLENTVNKAKRFYFSGTESFVAKDMKKMQKDAFNSSLKAETEIISNSVMTPNCSG